MKNKLIQGLAIAIVALTMIGCGSNSSQEEVVEMAGVEETETTDATRNETDDREGNKTEAQNETDEETMGVMEKEAEEAVHTEQTQVTKVVDNVDEFVQYMVTLDPVEPAIVIFNEGTGEIINIKDGEKYQLRSDDRIFVRHSEEITKHSSNGILSHDTSLDNHDVYNTNGRYAETGGVAEGYESELCAWEYVPDYTQYGKGEEVETKWKIFINDIEKLITVYLTTPL